PYLSPLSLHDALPIYFSVLAMGVYPYITAQIILQLLVPIIPALEARMKDDPRQGQKWMEKWTIVLTIPMALLSAIGQINIFTQLDRKSIRLNSSHVKI